jgi:hypothetical protein
MLHWFSGTLVEVEVAIHRGGSCHTKWAAGSAWALLRLPAQRGVHSLLGFPETESFPKAMVHSRARVAQRFSHGVWPELRNCSDRVGAAQNRKRWRL